VFLDKEDFMYKVKLVCSLIFVAFPMHPAGLTSWASLALQLVLNFPAKIHVLLYRLHYPLYVNVIAYLASHPLGLRCC
jgi:hypothetical protein